MEKSNWIKQLKTKLNAHPWDWISHIFLGSTGFAINYFLISALGEPSIKAALLAACNLILIVELVQIDVFGLSWRRFGDSVIDLIAGVFGIYLAISLIQYV